MKALPCGSTMPKPATCEHVHTIGRDGFRSCGCPDSHVSQDPNYDSSLWDGGETDYCGWDMVDDDYRG